MQLNIYVKLMTEKYFLHLEKRKTGKFSTFSDINKK
jgi:hypothetical protein